MRVRALAFVTFIIITYTHTHTLARTHTLLDSWHNGIRGVPLSYKYFFFHSWLSDIANKCNISLSSLARSLARSLLHTRYCCCCCCWSPSPRLLRLASLRRLAVFGTAVIWRRMSCRCWADVDWRCCCCCSSPPAVRWVLPLTADRGVHRQWRLRLLGCPQRLAGHCAATMAAPATAGADCRTGSTADTRSD